MKAAVAKQSQQEEPASPFAGKIFAIAGTFVFEETMSVDTVDDIYEVITSNGGTVTSDLTKADYLIAGTEAKPAIAQAKERGTTVLTLEQFDEMNEDYNSEKTSFWLSGLETRFRRTGVDEEDVMKATKAVYRELVNGSFPGEHWDIPGGLMIGDEEGKRHDGVGILGRLLESEADPTYCAMILGVEIGYRLGRLAEKRTNARRKE